MKYTLRMTNQFKKDVKLCKRRGYPMDELWKVLNSLMENGTLPQEYKAHKLQGNRIGEWECHIEPDWLLIWTQNDNELTLLMLNTGSHSDLFGKKKR